MLNGVTKQAIRNRIRWYVSRNPNNIQGTKKDAEDWAIRYLEGIGTTITDKLRESIQQLIDQEIKNL